MGSDELSFGRFFRVCLDYLGPPYMLVAVIYSGGVYAAETGLSVRLSAVALLSSSSLIRPVSLSLRLGVGMLIHNT